MKKLRKALAVFICVVIVLGLSATASAANANADIFTLTGIDRSKYAIDYRSTEANDRMMDSFGVKSGGEEYPDYYCGAYIDENGMLVVLTTSDNENTQALINDATKMDNVITKTATYSYNTLSELMAQMNKRYTSLDNALIEELGVASYGIDDELNRIAVYLLNNDDKHISLFENSVGKSEMLVFKKIDGDLSTYKTVVDSGSTIENIDRSVLCSIGFPAKKFVGGSWVYGFVSAGHSFRPNSADRAAYGSSGWVATTSIARFSGNCDAAFLVYNDQNNFSFSVSDFIRQDVLYLDPTGYSIVPVGSIVFKSGFATNVTSGSVTGTNQTVTAEVSPGVYVTLTGQTTTNLFTWEGDSGGPVYKPKTNGYEALIVGIVSSGSSNLYGDVLNCTPYYNIYSNLGCVIN